MVMETLFFDRSDGRGHVISLIQVKMARFDWTEEETDFYFNTVNKTHLLSFVFL